jgi:hypothetical protein
VKKCVVTTVDNSRVRSSGGRSGLAQRFQPFLVLAAGCVFARVLASPPVYAQTPPGDRKTKDPPRTQAEAGDSKAESKSTPEPKAEKPTAPPSPPSSKSSTPTPSPSTSKAPAKAKQERRRARGERGTSGRKISLDDAFLIEGKLEKPSAFYILRRSQAEYDWARLDAKFLPLVLESVQDPLF